MSWNKLKFLFSFLVSLTVPLFFYSLRIDPEKMLSYEYFNQKLFLVSFLKGETMKIIETPKPLWVFLFGSMPNPVYLFFLQIFVLFVLNILLLEVSKRLTKDTHLAILSLIVVYFSTKIIFPYVFVTSWVPIFLIFLFASYLTYSNAKLNLAFTLLTFAGLIRPEVWITNIYLILRGLLRKNITPSYGILLIPPILWALFDFRMSGSFLYSLKITSLWAYYSAILPTSFLDFWRRILIEFNDMLGFPIFALGTLGILAHLKKQKGKIIDDPIFPWFFAPLLGMWLASIFVKIYIMGRFYPQTLTILALLPLSLPPKKLKLNSILKILIIFLTLIYILFRYPKIYNFTREVIYNLSKGVVEVEEVKVEMERRGIDLSQFKYIFIPAPRYSQIYFTFSREFYEKCISYRELSSMVAWEKKPFKAYLPALAIWIHGDEPKYMPVFNFLNLSSDSEIEELQIYFHYLFSTKSRIANVFVIKTKEK